MKKLFLLTICSMFLFSATAYAGGGDPCKSKYLSKIVNDCSPHTVDTDTHAELDDEGGIGVDLLLHETKTFDVVAEYRRDFNNDSNSIYGVIKTKKSLFSIIKNVLTKHRNRTRN